MEPNIQDKLDSLRVLYQVLDLDDPLCWILDRTYITVESDGIIDYNVEGLYKCPTNMDFIGTELMINTVILDLEQGLGFILSGVMTERMISEVLNLFQNSYLESMFFSERSLTETLRESKKCCIPYTTEYDLLGIIVLGEDYEIPTCVPSLKECLITISPNGIKIPIPMVRIQRTSPLEKGKSITMRSSTHPSCYMMGLLTKDGRLSSIKNDGTETFDSPQSWTFSTKGVRALPIKNEDLEVVKSNVLPKQNNCSEDEAVEDSICSFFKSQKIFR